MAPAARRFAISQRGGYDALVPVSAIEQSEDQVHEAGEAVDGGSFVCVDCSLPLSLENSEPMPECPGCGGTRFQRASIFSGGAPTMEQPIVQASLGDRVKEPEGWLEDARESIEAPGKYLAFFADGRARVVELKEGWSRIGRSAAADIRLDDPTVSRRHAVVVRTPDGELSALDDRSTNGILVNGEAADWASIADGDELRIGRYRLHVIEAAGADAS
ncbi:MAG: FHA domain-containing protein [Actinobacteria bacterium]|nr:FHA domain-containing protein [Actinomycetota bacterium]